MFGRDLIATWANISIAQLWWSLLESTIIMGAALGPLIYADSNACAPIFALGLCFNGLMGLMLTLWCAICLSSPHPLGSPSQAPAHSRYVFHFLAWVLSFEFASQLVCIGALQALAMITGIGWARGRDGDYSDPPGRNPVFYVSLAGLIIMACMLVWYSARLDRCCAAFS